MKSVIFCMILPCICVVGEESHMTGAIEYVTSDYGDLSWQCVVVDLNGDGICEYIVRGMAEPNPKNIIVEFRDGQFDELGAFRGHNLEVRFSPNSGEYAVIGCSQTKVEQDANMKITLMYEVGFVSTQYGVIYESEPIVETLDP